VIRTLPLLFLLALPAAASAPSPAKAMHELAGVYKHRFTNGRITPGKQPMEADEHYRAEDIVEIVPHDATHIYIRARFEFYNGHLCAISGMARQEENAFVFHDPEPSSDGGPPCTLRISKSKQSLRLTDRPYPGGAASCRAYCGVRGSLSDVAVEMKSRRPIRYLNRIVQSRQYRKAIEDMDKFEKATP
jgi:hypothetical protein